MSRAPSSRVARPLLQAALVLALAAGAAARAAETPAPFVFEPPAFLEGPRVARALFGTTYAYLAAQGTAQLLITVIPAASLRAELGSLSPVACIRLFIPEIEAGHAGFFGVTMTTPLALAGHEFPRYRWNGSKAGRALTGVLSCGEVGAHYFVVHFVDRLETATRSFPAIRASLRALSVAPAGDGAR